MTKKRTWQVAEAKAHLSALLAEAGARPQVIERRGRPIAVVLGVDAYEAAEAKVAEGSAEARIRRLLETSAALRAAGGVTLRTGRRARRRSPLGGT